MTTPAEDREGALEAIQEAIARSRRLRLIVSDYVLRAENTLMVLKNEIKWKGTTMEDNDPVVAYPHHTQIHDTLTTVVAGHTEGIAATDITIAETATAQIHKDAVLADAAAILATEVAALNVSVNALQIAQDGAATKKELKQRTDSFRKWIGTVGAITGVVALFTVALVVLYVKQANSVACQARYNDAFRTAAIFQRDAAVTERSAQRQLLETSRNPVATTADRIKATQTYLDGLRTADKQRNDNPFPAETC